jgi:glycosyltransferase involved in cell wall biosynthesis
MSDGPLVSVVIPVFNAEAYITDTIRSAVHQTYGRIEVLVADDGSSDRTRDRVEAFGAGKNVRWIDASGRAGRPSVPRNRGLAAAGGELVAFLDADDLWSPRKIEDQVRVMREYPDLVLVYSILRAFGDGAGFARPGYGLRPWPSRAAVDADVLEMANTIPCSSVLVRRSVVAELGGFDEDPDLNAVEDFDLWLRVSRRGSIGFIPRIHGFYRVHATGISRDAGVQRDRARYLVRKRQLERFTFQEFRQRSLVERTARSVADVGATAVLLTSEWAARRLGRGVPLRRGLRGAATPS